MNSFELNKNLVFKYFTDLNHNNRLKYQEFERYFINFYKFCFELSPENMIREAIKFKN